MHNTKFRGLKMKKALIYLMALLVVAGITTAAEQINYEKDTIIGQDSLKYISNIVIDSEDRLIVGGYRSLSMFDATGKFVKNLEPGFEGTKGFQGSNDVKAVASDGSNIYVFANKMEIKEFEQKNRRYKKPVSVKVLCKVFDKNGQYSRDLDIPEMKSVRNALISDGKLYVSDMASGKVMVMDLKSGTITSKVGERLRLCCGIFDFAVDPSSKEVLIANLGAFKVERYEADGTKKFAFGKRGKEDSQFLGCCNPVSVAVLPSGNILTVEKDPSRVKIYTAKGELISVIDNIGELVKGCSYIPTAIDSKGNVYFGVNQQKLKKGKDGRLEVESEDYYVIKCTKTS